MYRSTRTERIAFDRHFFPDEVSPFEAMTDAEYEAEADAAEEKALQLEQDAASAYGSRRRW